jgi:micrococcal nuclease
VQCFAAEASAEAKKVLSGQTIRIELDPSQGTHDKYGRLLAYIYVPLNSNPEGLLFNKYMIAEGYGHEYTYRLPYKYQKDFKEAETQAREQKKGLWADDACAGNTKQPARS